MDSESKKREQRLRRQAKQAGLTLKKSRAAKGDDNRGGYMLLHTQQWIAMAGHRFELTIDEVETWLMEHSAQLMP
jgi:hypothetical protein